MQLDAIGRLWGTRFFFVVCPSLHPAAPNALWRCNVALQMDVLVVWDVLSSFTICLVGLRGSEVEVFMACGINYSF